MLDLKFYTAPCGVPRIYPVVACLLPFCARPVVSIGDLKVSILVGRVEKQRLASLHKQAEFIAAVFGLDASAPLWLVKQLGNVAVAA